ncbi:interleukin-13 receptor subunit alpha-2 [Salarias fasciatus]|uniref:interleukin-13 receptor subunit alpha-2 n=1 Tax=Salarias fasciatus TaxID=181472 RepID=UPI001176C518|nr:interleukin-13 receptor subunit alpha-2 [Salarias fasciatus]
MATGPWLAGSAALMLLLVVHCRGLTVSPPEDLQVLDPGHLGHMVITWSPPVNMDSMTECTVQYQLEYFNTYRNSWSAIRTKLTTYSAQFDLMKDVRVRVYTLLGGPCTNNTMIMSANYTEVIQKPSDTGIMDTEIRDFKCVFQNMEYMECKWTRSPNTPAKSQLNLFFWHEELDQAEECPKYIFSRGIRRGCNFTEKPLPDFTDINFCVNGSSPQGPLKQTFISLQIQNYVKPAAVEKMYLQTGPDLQLELHWEPPAGSIPEHCLEWEVKCSRGDPVAKLLPNPFTLTSLSLPSAGRDKRRCYKVRSKLHKYCADKSFWSDWSQKICHTRRCRQRQRDFRKFVFC